MLSYIIHDKKKITIRTDCEVIIKYNKKNPKYQKMDKIYRYNH